MIISNLISSNLCDFQKLLINANDLLNAIAKKDPVYFKDKGGQKLEIEVKHVMDQVAKGTDFEDTIKLIGGQHFPDIVAKKYFGVEVKSTTKNHWLTIGNSVLESTRVEDVEHIFLLFGKLVAPAEFKVRRYQDCLSDVVVTHYPRYKINMELPSKQTIFDKMNIDYDEIRKLNNPITPIVNYYKSKLQEGEALWWIDNVSPESQPIVPMTVRLWRTLTKEEKNFYIAKGFILFPEIFGKSSKKYDRFTLWLATNYGVISTSARDSFSAGGEVSLAGLDNIPQIYWQLFLHRDIFLHELNAAEESTFSEFWEIYGNEKDRLLTWIDNISKISTLGADKTRVILSYIFHKSSIF